MPLPPKKPLVGPNRGTLTTSSPCAGMELDEGITIEPTPTIAHRKKAQAFNDASLHTTHKPDYSTFTYQHVWGIFEPFWNVANQDVFICSWNIQHPSNMDERIINGLRKAKHVRILVRYNRSEHHLDRLEQCLRDYQAHGFQVRALPNFHAKIWGVGDRAWVGSCNFVPNTIHNYMQETTWSRVHDFVSHYWQQALTYTKTTKLELCPQPQSFGTERNR